MRVSNLSSPLLITTLSTLVCRLTSSVRSQARSARLSAVTKKSKRFQPFSFWGQKIAFQKSTPQKSSWILSGISQRVVQWHFPTYFHCSVVFSKGLSVVRWIFIIIVQWIVSDMFQLNFTFVISGVLYFAPILGLEEEAREAMLVHPEGQLGYVHGSEEVLQNFDICS